MTETEIIAHIGSQGLIYPHRHLENGFRQVFRSDWPQCTGSLSNPIVAPQDSLLANKLLFEVSTLVPACPLAGFGLIMIGRF